MTPEEFVAAFAREKTELMERYKRDRSTFVGTKLAELALDRDKARSVEQVLDACLTDAFYTILLALDGEASLGGTQELYTLHDEDGNRLTGRLAPLAWKHFHEASKP